MSICRLLLPWILFFSLLFVPHLGMAVGINTNVALPVAKGQSLIRVQTRYTFANHDPAQTGRRLHELEFPMVFGYGVSSQMALFGVVPVVYRNLSGVQNQGIGDLTFLLRQEIAKKDWHLRTFRLALLGGLEIPSGDRPFTSNSLDIPLGLVSSYQTHQEEWDCDLHYQINTEGLNRDHGDNFFYNLAYQRRILPWKLPETGLPNQLNLVLELNGEWTQRDENIGGGVIANTGGHMLFLSPGLQYVLRQVILETSFQYPVVRDLNGNQLESTYAIIGSIRLQI